MTAAYPEDSGAVWGAAQDAAIVAADSSCGHSIAVSLQHLHWDLQTQHRVLYSKLADDHWGERQKTDIYCTKNIHAVVAQYNYGPASDSNIFWATGAEILSFGFKWMLVLQ